MPQENSILCQCKIDASSIKQLLVLLASFLDFGFGEVALVVGLEDGDKRLEQSIRRLHDVSNVDAVEFLGKIVLSLDAVNS